MIKKSVVLYARGKRGHFTPVIFDMYEKSPANELGMMISLCLLCFALGALLMTDPLTVANAELSAIDFVNSIL